MSDPMISVIVPVYQTAQFLDECLNSIARSTLSDLEVLMIDDGSDDGSAAICDRKASEDSRFKCFHRKHAGISSSRDFGLEQACGQYVAWVDSDDSISEDYLETLYRAAKAHDADWVVATDEDMQSSVLKDAETIKQLLNGQLGVLWNSLIKRERYRGKRFADVPANEDGIMLAQIAFDHPKVVKVRNAGYHYRVRESSAVHQLQAKSLMGRLEALELRNECVRLNMPEYYRFTHYSSVVEATKINRLIRHKRFEGDDQVKKAVKRTLRKHLFAIPLSSLSGRQYREVLAGYKVLLIG